MNAPGRPGHTPHWTSSQKQAVGTALSPRSPLWFTLGRGVLNEVYYPRLDCACTRDLRFVVTDAGGYFCDEVEGTEHSVEWLAPGIPSFRVHNRCPDGRFELAKEIVSDPNGPVLLQRIRFVALDGKLEDYFLHALLAPHLDNQGLDNSALLADYKGLPLLAAERPGFALAMAPSEAWLQRSVGYTGVSDGRQQLARNGRLDVTYSRAERGNVTLTGQIDLGACGGEFVLGLALGATLAEAGYHLKKSLALGFEAALQAFRQEWEDWQEDLLPLGLGYRASTAVLGTHRSKLFSGAMIASASIPRGSAAGDKTASGYHVMWPRDAYETAGGLLAAGAGHEAREALFYFETTQEPDGHWPQCMWLDGTPQREGIQLDETAAPVLLLELAERHGLLRPPELRRLWPMVRLAAAYLVRHGPCTEQDRWEETSGYSPYTMGAQIAALLQAAELADRFGEPRVAEYLRETADAWNECVERWCWAEDTELARRHGVDGYYVRLAPRGRDESRSLAEETTIISNHPAGPSKFPASAIVSPDALELVRFGLRAPDDPRILQTLEVIDGELRVETPFGPCWHRFSHDAYGEHPDGTPFDGAGGQGRAWPILTGERAHYELAAGHRTRAEQLLATLESFGAQEGLLPEQVWDTEDLPERGLFRGRPTFSARPLAWAHAEHVKLLRSLRDDCVFDMPGPTRERYLQRGVRAAFTVWSLRNRLRFVLPDQALRLQTEAPACVRYSWDGWSTARELECRATGLGTFLADLPVEGEAVEFTFRWLDSGDWQGADYRVEVAERMRYGLLRPRARHAPSCRA